MKYILITLLAGLFYSCSALDLKQVGPQPITSINQISSEDYVLDNMFKSNQMTIGFDKSGRVFGYSGINRYFGKVTIFDGQFKITDLGSTKMAGTKDDMANEFIFMNLLQSMTTISEKNGELILSNGKDQLIFKKETNETKK